MKILFLGDIVGDAGCVAVKKHLKAIIENNKINFVIANGENAAIDGVGITENNVKELISSGVDVITTGNHVWDQKETLEFIKIEKRLLRPENLLNDVPGSGFEVYKSKKGLRVGVLNLMGNIFMKKCRDVFEVTENFIDKYKLKKNYDFLVVDFHGEITSEKMAAGHILDGHATIVVGTHTHVPTNDARILENGTAYLTDAGMCGDYDSVIGMDKTNSLKRFFKTSSLAHFPATGKATICGVIVEANNKTGLAKKIDSFIFGGKLQKK